MDRARIRWTLVVALAAHAGVYAWMRRIPPSSSAVSVSTAPPVEIDVSVEPVKTTPLESSADAPAPSEHAADHPRVAEAPSGPRGQAKGATATGATGAAEVGEVVTSSDSAPDGQGWTFSPIQPGAPSAGAGGGRGGSAEAFAQATRAGVDAVVARAAQEDEARARKRMVPLFSKHDIELGMAPGAHLAPLTSDRVRRSNTPDVGHAVLEFRTDSTGVVAAVRVLEASSGHTDWNDVATELVADAKSRPLRVPSEARGLVVTIDVTSTMKTVTGAATGGSTITKIGRAIENPLDTIVDSRTPPRRVVVARVVAVDLL